MPSNIIVGVHPHSTILLHQPVDGSGVASVNFFGTLPAEQIVTKALLFFGVHIDINTVRDAERQALPTGYGANRNQSFSYTIAGERCHTDAKACPSLATSQATAQHGPYCYGNGCCRE